MSKMLAPVELRAARRHRGVGSVGRVERLHSLGQLFLP